MKNKAIILHVDRSTNILRTSMNIIQCLYTIWYLRQIRGIDVIVHSVHHTGQFFNTKNIEIAKFIEAGELAIPIKQCMYFTRLYSLLHPKIQGYDEVMMFDTDFEVIDFNELQKIIGLKIDERSYGVGVKYVNPLNMECFGFGMLKINMKLLKKVITKENLEQVLVDYENNNWKNYEECAFTELIRRFGGTISSYAEKPYVNVVTGHKAIHSKCLVHYGYTKSLSNKIRHTLNVISDYDFIQWVKQIGLIQQFTAIVNDVIDKIMQQYDSQFELMDKKQM